MNICIVANKIERKNFNWHIGVHTFVMTIELKKAGHDVTVILTNEYEHIEDTIEHLRRIGVELVMLWKKMKNNTLFPHWGRDRSLSVHQWLSAQKSEFDIVCFADDDGLGYIPIQAKRTTTAYANTAIATVLNKHVNAKEEIPSEEYLKYEFMRRYCAMNSDALLAVDSYTVDVHRMLGWKLADNLSIFPYLTYDYTAKRNVADPNKLLLINWSGEPREYRMFFDGLEAAAYTPDEVTVLRGYNDNDKNTLKECIGNCQKDIAIKIETLHSDELLYDFIDAWDGLILFTASTVRRSNILYMTRARCKPVVHDVIGLCDLPVSDILDSVRDMEFEDNTEEEQRNQIKTFLEVCTKTARKETTATKTVSVCVFAESAIGADSAAKAIEKIRAHSPDTEIVVSVKKSNNMEPYYAKTLRAELGVTVVSGEYFTRGEALDAAAEQAKGDVLIFIDQFTEVAPGMVESFLHGISTGENDCLTAWVRACSSFAHYIGEENILPYWGAIGSLCATKNYWGLPLAIKRDVFERVRFEEREKGADVWAMILKVIRLGYTFDAIPETLAAVGGDVLQAVEIEAGSLEETICSVPLDTSLLFALRAKTMTHLPPMNSTEEELCERIADLRMHLTNAENKRAEAEEKNKHYEAHIQGMLQSHTWKAGKIITALPSALKKMLKK